MSQESVVVIASMARSAKSPHLLHWRHESTAVAGKCERLGGTLHIRNGTLECCGTWNPSSVVYVRLGMSPFLSWIHTCRVHIQQQQSINHALVDPSSAATRGVAICSRFNCMAPSQIDGRLHGNPA